MRQTLTTLTTTKAASVAASIAASIGIGVAAVLTAPAQAAIAPVDNGARTVASAPVERGTDQPTRDLHDRIVKRHGRLYFQGRVDPGHGPVIVQKKACSSKDCPWRKFASVKTHGTESRWKVRIYAPKHGNWYWRGYVKASGGYAKSWTHVYKTYTTRF